MEIIFEDGRLFFSVIIKIRLLLKIMYWIKKKSIIQSPKVLFISFWDSEKVKFCVNKLSLMQQCYFTIWSARSLLFCWELKSIKWIETEFWW